MLNYNKIAGQSTSRIEAISDGVFAVAMTLLVLDIRVPISESIQTEAELAHAFVALIPKFLIYFLSFMTAGIFWTGQAAQFRYIKKSDRNVNWISLLFLVFVAFIPFSTAFLSEHISFKFSIFVYWLNILCLGGMLYINWQYASKKGFIDVPDSEKEAVSGAIKNRIIVAQLWYAFGALLCFINIYLSIAVIIVIQLNYAFAFIPSNKNRNKTKFP